MESKCDSRSVVLCVDHERTGLELRKRVLEQAGYRVLTAMSVHRALELFRANRIDLVLAEHILPNIVDGPTLAATLKMLRPEVPIAILSAEWELPEDRRFADAFITKLASIDELLHEIERVLGKARTVARAA